VNPNYLATYAVIAYLRNGKNAKVLRTTGAAADEARIIVTAGATPGSHTGTVAGPFTLVAHVDAQAATFTGIEAENFNISTGVNDKFLVAIVPDPGASPYTVTLTAGSRTAAQICGELNAGSAGLTFAPDGGKIKVTHNTTGAAATFTVTAVANDCYTTLGFTAAVGVAKAGADVIAGTDYIKLVIDTGHTITGYLGGGTLTASQVATAINALTDFSLWGLAEVVNNKIKISSLTTGAASNLTMHADSLCETALGWDNVTYTGVASGGTAFTAYAYSKGVWANGFQVVTSAGSISSTFKLTVKDTGGNSLYVADVLDMDPTSPYFIMKKISSHYIEIDMTGSTLTTPTLGTFTLAAGVDAAALDADFVASLQAFTNVDRVDVNLLAVPGEYAHAVVTELLTIAETRGDCLALIDPPIGFDVSEVIDWHNGWLAPNSSHVAYDSSYGALFWPWLKVQDYTNKQEVWVPPSGFVAGAIAYTDFNAEVWQAPAGPVYGRLINVMELEFEADQGDRDLLYGNGNAVNPIIAPPRHGVTIFGQRTLQRAPTAMDRINVRRLLLYLRKTIAASSYLLLFQLDDAVTWRRFKGLVEPFLEGVKNRRGLNSYAVKCDAATNPPDAIARNEMHGVIILDPTRVAEIIQIDFVVTPSGADLNEFTI